MERRGGDQRLGNCRVYPEWYHWCSVGRPCVSGTSRASTAHVIQVWYGVDDTRCWPETCVYNGRTALLLLLYIVLLVKYMLEKVEANRSDLALMSQDSVDRWILGTRYANTPIHPAASIFPVEGRCVPWPKTCVSREFYFRLEWMNLCARSAWICYTHNMCIPRQCV